MSRILLLEDDKVLSQTMQTGLQGEGFDVIVIQEPKIKYFFFNPVNILLTRIVI